MSSALTRTEAANPAPDRQPATIPVRQAISLEIAFTLRPAAVGDGYQPRVKIFVETLSNFFV